MNGTTKVRTALLIIDAQESFRHRHYWTGDDYPAFIESLHQLIAGAAAQGIPIVRIFHIDPEGPFSDASGYVRTLSDLELTSTVTFYKKSHSALVGSGLDVWLIQHGIERLIISGIRSEQCCETTTRHASDLGYWVNYVTEATLTFPMVDKAGRTWTTPEIKERTELVLQDRFADVVSVRQAIKVMQSPTSVRG